MTMYEYTDAFDISYDTVTTFVASAFFSHGNKLDMVHVQNSTLAGGVGVGAVCNLLIGPSGAIGVGVMAGAVSVLGYRYLSVSLQTYMHMRIDMYTDFCSAILCSILCKCVCRCLEIDLKCVSRSLTPDHKQNVSMIRKAIFRHSPNALRNIP